MWVLVRTPSDDAALDVGILDLARRRRGDGRPRREPLDTNDELHLKNVLPSNELGRVLGRHDTVKVVYNGRVLALFEPGSVEELLPGAPITHVVVRRLQAS